MAEWGKGDPRWIVEEREDGKNVNAWHWEEKDCTKWCRDRLEALLRDVPLTDGDKSVTLQKVTKFEGEVNWYNRKGKLFTLYDLEIALDFNGRVGTDEVAGTIKVQDFEQDAENKAQFRVTVSKGPSEQAWRNWLLDASRNKFLEVWTRVVLELHEEQKARIPALSQNEQSGKVKLPEVVQRVASSPQLQEAKKAPPTNGSVSFAIVFQASPQDLYDLFTSQRRAESFSQAPSRVDGKEGGLFSLYDGTISGCFVELQPHTRIRFRWRLRDWSDGHNSDVTVTLTRTKEGTKLELLQTNVPQPDVERTKDGWKKFYFERWRGVFGYHYDDK